MIPVFDIKRQNQSLEKALHQAISRVIDRGIFILGSKVEEFERLFARFIGVQYAVGVASGTDAISLALLSIGVNPGDEVIMPANAYPTAFAVTAIGVVPKLVDIDPSTYNINPDLIEKAITSKTKAILPVHLYGLPSDMNSIMRIARKHNLKVIEDCAQAVGSSIKYQAASSKYNAKIKNKLATNYLLHTTTQFQEQKVGSFGEAGCFSFYPTKNLGCFGDGGMVVTNNKEIYDKVKLLRMYGEKTRYNSVILGRNSRLDELQAAILLVKLKYLDKRNERRREIAKKYIAQLLNCSIANETLSNGTMKQWNNLHLPYDAPYTKHIYHLFVIRVQKRDELKAYLEKKGILTAIHYPTPVHLQESFRYLGYRKGDFPVAEKSAKEILSLPMFPELSKTEIEKVVSEVKEFFVRSQIY